MWEACPPEKAMAICHSSVTKLAFIKMLVDLHCCVQSTYINSSVYICTEYIYKLMSLTTGKDRKN